MSESQYRTSREEQEMEQYREQVRREHSRTLRAVVYLTFEQGEDDEDLALVVTPYEAEQSVARVVKLYGLRFYCAGPSRHWETTDQPTTVDAVDAQWGRLDESGDFTADARPPRRLLPRGM